MNMKENTSWESAAKWYDSVVGKAGHYYHEHVIIPETLRLLEKKPPSVLDLGCGQGVLARALPKESSYVGVDAARSLIDAARKRGAKCPATFYCHDLLKPLELKHPPFSHATCILALQNIQDPLPLLKTAYQHLQPSGKCILVLNHPCFRIPRQSHWTIDEKKKLQSRTIDRYMAPLKIPIHTAPSLHEKSSTTWSFHFPISFYTRSLKSAGFLLEDIEEWCSDKVSTGKAAAMENRCRKEFPLFLTLIAQKR